MDTDQIFEQIISELEVTDIPNFELPDVSDLDLPLLSGSSEEELLIGSADGEAIIGLEGNDFLIGKAGNDLLAGGAGDDSLESGRGDNLLLGDEGDDFLDVATLRDGEAGNNTLLGGVGDDEILGNDGDDLLAGEAGQDFLDGFDGNDIVLGQEQADSLFGDRGNDFVDGGDGDDELNGGDDNDRLQGGAGADSLFGGEGTDTLIGGEDADSFGLVHNTGADIIEDFQDGQDQLVLESTERFGQELTFERLAITQGEGETTIAIAETGEVLVSVQGVSADRIGREDFISSEELDSMGEMESEAPSTDSSTPQEAEDGSASDSSIGETGLVTSQGVEVIKADEARAQFDVDGSGVTIGVLANSFDRGLDVVTTAEDDIFSGDLPGEGNPNGDNTPVTVLDDTADNSAFDLNDEGRALIQLAYDVAPGANFLFHTGLNSAENFAQGVDELVAAGADIIVEDIFNRNEPFFQDGVIAQAADRAFASGVPYFSSAGNDNRSSYESEFRPVESSDQIDIAGLEDYRFHDFDPGEAVDILQNFTLDPDGSITLNFQWDNPFASAGGKGATSDLDIFLLDESNNIVAASAQSNIGFDAVERLIFSNDSEEAAEYKLLIGQNTSAGGEAPNRIKYIDSDFGTLGAKFSTLSSTLFGAANAEGAEAIGSSFYQTPTELDFDSSGGITPILFDTNGERLSEPEIRQKPDLIAPEGTNTTFFGPEDTEEDGFPNFFGTSAAAPHAAGVAALLLEASPEASPEKVYQALEETALDLDDPYTPESDPGFDENTGFGLIQADAALEAILNQSDGSA